MLDESQVTLIRAWHFIDAKAQAEGQCQRKQGN